MLLYRSIALIPPAGGGWEGGPTWAERTHGTSRSWISPLLTSPAGGRETHTTTFLEARPEADFPTQGGIGATTPRARRVGPNAARHIAVPQVCQINVAPQRNGNVAR
jgi:hypothetical protein